MKVIRALTIAGLAMVIASMWLAEGFTFALGTLGGCLLMVAFVLAMEGSL